MGFLKNLSAKLSKALGVEQTSNSSSNYTSGYQTTTGTFDSDNTPIYNGWLRNPVINTSSSNAELSRKGSTIPSRDIQGMSTNIDIPAWGYKDYINERVSWQKGLDTLYGDPSWMYFKIFFKFDSPYGLLGGVLNRDGKQTTMTNTARQYLHRNYIARGSNDVNGLYARQTALINFVKLLSRISCKEPWLFSSIKDVNQALTMDFENLSHEKELEIECRPDTTDWLLSTLFNLYKYACFDEINMKEVVPENLRKFDMDVVVFQAPIRYFHTSSRDLKGRSAPYKNFAADNYGDRMSFQLFSFLNCEFDYKSLSAALPQNLTSELPFENKPTFKIKYERSYQHMNNEFLQMMFGSEGLLFDREWFRDDATSQYNKDKTAAQQGYDETYKKGVEKVGIDTYRQTMRENIINPIADINVLNLNGMPKELQGSGSLPIVSITAKSQAERNAQYKQAEINATNAGRNAVERKYGATLNYFKSKEAEADNLANTTTKYSNPSQAKRIEMLKYGDTNSLYYNPNSTVYKALVDASESTIGNAMIMMDTSTVLGNLYGNENGKPSTAIDDIKGIYKNVVNGYKNLGKNVWDSFTHVL